MDNSVGGQEGNKPDEVVYSSNDILTESIAGKRGRFFTRISGKRPKQQRTKPKKIADFLSKRKKLVIVCLSAIIVISIATIITLWIFIWQRPADEVVTENNDNTTETEAVSWEEELESLNDEIGDLLLDDAEESNEKATEIYEEKLAKHPAGTAEYTDIILNYAQALIYAEKFLDAQKVLQRLDINSYNRPNNLSELDYVHQKLEYRALMRDTLTSLGATEEAATYDKEIDSLMNEESKLTGEKADHE